jgi:hypothetical protein
MEEKYNERPAPLPQQINEWWAMVPDEEKRMSYSMDFFVSRFGTTRQKLGVALFSLGWERRRRWEPGKPYSRYWVKK